MTNMSKRPVELARGTYTAFQIKGLATIVAVVNAPSPGYRIWLGPRPEDVDPPFHELLWQPPDGVVPEVLTLFQVCTSFKANPTRTLYVFDADGQHAVAVEQLEKPTSLSAEIATGQLANAFSLQGGNARVTYAESEIAGRPALTYNGANFAGDQVGREESSLGTLITVTLEEIPDLRRTTFTLIVPAVQVESRGATPVRLIGLKATSQMTIAGSPQGQRTTYEVEELDGEATIRYTLH